MTLAQRWDRREKLTNEFLSILQTQSDHVLAVPEDEVTPTDYLLYSYRFRYLANSLADLGGDSKLAAGAHAMANLCGMVAEK